MSYPLFKATKREQAEQRERLLNLSLACIVILAVFLLVFVL